MNDGMNMLIFVDAANTAYSNTAANFRGISHNTDDKLDVYFASATTSAGYDKIILSITDEKELEAMRGLSAALAGAKTPYLTVADDVNSTYAHPNITAVDSISLSAKAVNAVVESVTGNDTLTAADSGKTFVFADAAAVLTLPDSGAGDIIGWTAKFISNFQGTGQEVICADTTNEVMLGGVIHVDTDDDTTTKSFAAEVADGFSSIEITGTTEGEPGSLWTLTCIAADRWIVEGVMQSAGTSATPFAAS